MASYKVIQDIEAEDKLIWNLSLRQFIYALVSVVSLYISYTIYQHGAWLLDFTTMPFALFFGFLAFPFMRDQPTEVWALAKLRFIIKPKLRIWDQDGANNLVTVTAPKKIDKIMTNGLTQNEVQSRLETLAGTLDSRGWSIKNMENVNKYVNPLETNGDRLINIDSLQSYPKESEVHDFEDMLDDSNPDLRRFQQMVDVNTQQRKAALINNMDNQENLVSQNTATPVPNPIDKDSGEFVNMRTLRPANNSVFPEQNNAPQQFQPSPDIINLSQNNINSIATISNEVNKAPEPRVQENNGEVVISIR